MAQTRRTCFVACRKHAAALLRATQRALGASTEASWSSAAAAAIAVAGRLEGRNPYAQPYHAVMGGEAPAGCLCIAPRLDWGLLLSLGWLWPAPLLLRFRFSCTSLVQFRCLAF
jgi:hypothetical protein